MSTPTEIPEGELSTPKQGEEGPDSYVSPVKKREKKKMGEVLYLTHSEIHSVFQKGNPRPHVYFNIKTLGISSPFRIYKNKAQELCNALSEALDVGKDLIARADTETLQDRDYYNHTLSESSDSLSDARFRLNLVVSSYGNTPYMHLRTYIYLHDEQTWQPTKRAVRFAINDREVHSIKNFIDEKIKSTLEVIGKEKKTVQFIDTQDLLG